MSVARGSQNAGHYYSNIVMPYLIQVSFTVTSTNGLGVTSVKSNGWVRNVFMHTSTTPSVGNDGVTNPNPESGVVLIQMKQNFNVFLGAQLAYLQAPVTGGAGGTLTANKAYQIVTVGTTTTAQWVAGGFPAGVTPAVGASFIASTSGAIGGTGTFKGLTVSGVDGFEVLGDPNQTISNSNIAVNGGAYIIGQFTAADVLTNPTDTTVVGLNLFFDRSSVTIDGL